MNANQIAMKIKGLRVSGFIESANKWETCEPDGLNGEEESRGDAAECAGRPSTLICLLIEMNFVRKN
jgi:hypothetical protein